MKRIFSAGATLIGACASVLIALGPAAASAAATVPATVHSPAAAGLARIMMPLAAGTAPAITNCGGRQEQFTVGPGNHLYHRFQSRPGGSYSPWFSLGGILVYSTIGAVVNVNCHVEVFGVGKDLAMWHIWQTNPGRGPWSGWASLGGAFRGGPFLASVDTSREVAIVAPWFFGGDACDHQEHPASGPWTGWYRCVPV
jgi:hypothetical protein